MKNGNRIQIELQIKQLVIYKFNHDISLILEITLATKLNHQSKTFIKIIQIKNL